MNPAGRTVTVPHPGSHDHQVPSLSLSLESYVCRSHRGRVSGVRVRPRAREALSVGSWPPAHVRAVEEHVSLGLLLRAGETFKRT